ncbi:MAG TPA: single-stranded-DNA-specific exonuclease RecJ [Chloroflexi bacterium]|nr:single-stranded-DNA-specific exonuclease RecJ [Chloroflexota bacterium]
MPKCNKHWQIAPSVPPSHVKQFPDLHPITIQVLYNRGIVKAADVAAFLDGGPGELNPFALPDVTAAVTRLRRALRAREPMAIYGDFDADGVTATVLLVQTLRALGGEVIPYIPHRVDEGYGLHTSALEQLAHEGVRVVVTVDCGVRSVGEIEYANSLGLDVIVTDHHSVPSELPPAVAVIDLKRTDPAATKASTRLQFPFDQLAGVGVAFKLAQALLRSHGQTPVTDENVRLTEADLLDLVALGSVADMVPLLGENRSLVSQGLTRLNRMERPGIEALCRQAGIKPGQVDASTINYTLAPRLNAAGRIDHAKLAYQLLETRYPAEAQRLAAELNRLNQERQQITHETQARVREFVMRDLDETCLLFAAAPDFQAGIVGLVASRIVDEFYRPAVVVEMGPEFSRGSARSIPEFHITEALDQCTDLLVRYGGHAAAAGFTVSNDQLDSLEARLCQIATEQLVEVELTPVLNVDVEIELAQISWTLKEELDRLEPCGYANPSPLFLSRDVRLQNQRAVGRDGRHLKLALYDGRVSWDAIAFRQGEWAGKLPDRVDLVYHLEVNEWNERKSLQLNVQDVRPAGCDENLTTG